MSGGELLARDVHPAEILLGDQLLAGVRAFVTTRRLLAYGVSAGGRVEQVLDVELAVPGSVPANRGTLTGGRLEIVLADGRVAWVNRGGGCGCGSPLKTLVAPVPWTQTRGA